MFSRNATKSIILFCLMIFTFGLIGCSNLFSLTPFGNVIFSFKLPSHLQASRGGETSYTLRVSLHEKNDAVFQSVEKIIGGGEQTLISFPDVPIDKEIYVKASLFKNNSLVYSGKTEVIKVVKGDNRVKLALDKSYMVTFSWEGKTKQIEVKSGNLIPVSEIPEIYAPDGKAVVWYNGNNAFSFSNGINEELSLSSKVVDITAETVCDVIKTRYGDMEQLVKLEGNCSSELVIKMGAALKENPNAKIILDLGDVTGLTEIPQEALAANNALFGIILPKTGLTKIGYWALGALYNVKNIEIPASVTEIDKAAFQECISLESIVIPEGIAQISERTFNWCKNLETITIPVTVTSIGFESFNGCEALTTINYAGTKALWDEIFIDNKNECLSKATINYGSISEIPSETINVEASEAASKIAVLSGRNLVIVEGNCDSETVSAIGNALRDSSAQILLDLGDVTGLTEIPYEAFVYNNNLVEITLPESVTNINYRTFAYSNLRAINIPANVEYIDNEAFVGCAQLTNIDVAENNSYFSSENGVIYNKEETVLLSYPSASGRIEFLDSVIRIGDYAFKNSRIETLNIPDHITSMGVGAFYNCYSLTSVESFGGVSSIPNLAFYCCNSLESITVPENIISIGSSVFDCCVNLKDVEIQGNISVIEDRTFYNCCNMNIISIPASVTEIKDGAFLQCEVLETVNYAGTKDLWDQIYIGSGNEYLINAKINYGAVSEVPEIPTNEITVTASEAANTIASLSGRNLVKVTGECDSNIVSEIGNALKENNNAQIFLDLSIVSGLTSIPQDCFRNSNSLVEITLPDSVEVIGSQAFSWCSSLQSVNNLGNISTIESWCFGVCGNLQSITIPASVTSIGQSAFSYCNNLRDIVIDEGNANFTVKNRAIYTKDEATLVAYPSASETVVIPENVTTIGAGAFAGSKIKSITLPTSVTEIGNAAFHECTSLVSITIPESVTKISQEAFNCCSGLTSIVIPSSVTTIEHGVFHLCYNLKSVEILGNISVIQSRTFENCESLESITIPATVTSIEEGAFNGCSYLSNVTYTGTEQMWNAIDIIEEGNSCLEIASLTCTGDFTEVPEIPVTDIPVEASAAASKIKGLTGRNRVIVTGDCDSETVSQIGDALRENNDAQIFLDLSDVSGLTSIPSYCFSCCENLQSITIPASVTSIGHSAFSSCNNLTNIEIEEGNANFTVNEGAIYTEGGTTLVAYPSASETVVIQDGVTTIGAGAFAGSLIEGITLPDSLTEIGNAAFKECTSLISITIPKSVTKISKEAFHFCDNLSSVTFDDLTDWYVSQNQDSGSDGDPVDVDDSSYNAELLLGEYCNYYWTKVE